MTITIREGELDRVDRDGVAQCAGGPQGFDVFLWGGETIHFESEDDAERLMRLIADRLGFAKRSVNVVDAVGTAIKAEHFAERDREWRGELIKAWPMIATAENPKAAACAIEGEAMQQVARTVVECRRRAKAIPIPA